MNEMFRSQSYIIGDYSFCLRYDPKVFANLIDNIYPCARNNSGIEGDTFHLLRNGPCYCILNGSETRIKADCDDFFSALEWEITTAALAHNQHFLQLHCGGLLHDEQVVIIPGWSNSGKTTLVMELMRRGAKVFSDEIFLVDRKDGLFAPFPRSFLVKENSYSLFPDISRPETKNGYCFWEEDVNQMIWYQDPREIAPEPFNSKTRIRNGAIFFPSFSSGSNLSLESVTPINVMRHLVPQSLNMMKNEKNSFMVLGDLAADFPGFTLKFSSLCEAVDCILDTLSTLKK